MIKATTVYFRDEPVGILAQGQTGYFFRYTQAYVRNKAMPAIAITLPKQNKTFHSDVFFPFFFGLLTEGVQKATQCRLMKIDERDYLTRLAKTSKYGVIGAVHVEERGDECKMSFNIN